IVLSWPGEMDADCKRWQARSVKWLQDTYGDQLKTVIRHDDEAFPHLHAFIVPDDLKAISLHPGDSAKQKAKADGLSPKEQNEAYKQSFRDWQDSYWDKVGKPSGLTRIGPGRRRLTRDQWNQEKQQAKALAIALADGRAVAKRVDAAKAKAEKFEKAGTLVGAVSSAVAGGVVQVSESFTKSRFDDGAKSRENEIHLLKNQNEKLKASN
ncbi:plasmid recombination protein, partial [Gluconobacter sp. P1D12_c]